MKTKLRLSNPSKTAAQKTKTFSKTPLRRFDGDGEADRILVRESEFSFVDPKPEFYERRSELRVDEEVGRRPEEAVARLEPELLGSAVGHPAIGFASSDLNNFI